MSEFVSEAERIERCLANVSKVGVWLERVVRVIGAFLSVIFLAIPITGIHAYYSPNVGRFLTIDECLSALPCGVLIAVVSFFTWRLADMLAKGRSPFTSKSFHSLVAIAVSFALFGIVELVLFHNGLGGVADPASGAVVMSGSFAAVLSFLFAGVMGVLAYVFRYGMLLQQQSDYMI